jgi:hypothetical protein
MDNLGKNSHKIIFYFVAAIDPLSEKNACRNLLARAQVPQRVFIISLDYKSCINYLVFFKF